MTTNKLSRNKRILIILELQDIRDLLPGEIVSTSEHKAPYRLEKNCKKILGK